MTARFIDMLLQRSPRERALLGLLIFVFLPIVVFFSLLLPLRDAQDTAKQQQQDAIALHRCAQDRSASSRFKGGQARWGASDHLRCL